MRRVTPLRGVTLAASFAAGLALAGVALGRSTDTTAASASHSAASESSVSEEEAAPGEGRELFIARCTSCHSVDYVSMHARFGTRALWEMEVAKMRNAFKAPLSDDEARRIVDYLARAYGPPAQDRP
jgi:sulfite dehydrogenase